MKEIKKAVIWSIIGGILSFGGKYLIDTYNNREVELQYRVQYAENIFNTPSSVNSRITILLDSTKISNISILRIELYNTSGKSLSDVEFTYELNNGVSENVDIISQLVYGQNQNKQFITSHKKEGILVHSKVKVANSLGFSEPVYTAEYLFNGNINKELSKVNILNRNIRLTEYNPYSENLNLTILAIFIVVVIVVSLVLSMIYISGKIERKKEYKARFKRLEHIAVQFKTNRRQDFDKLDKPVETIDNFENIRSKYYFEKEPKLFKRLGLTREPLQIKQNDLDKLSSKYGN